jgi:hypothetical protein
MGNDEFNILKKNEAIRKAWKEFLTTKKRQCVRSHVNGNSAMIKQHC